MPRKYKRKEGATPRVAPDPENLKAAIEAVKAGGSFKGTAKSFRVPLMTLKRLVRSGRDTIPGYKKAQIFSSDEEQELAEYLLTASQLYYGLTISALRKLAFQLAKKNNKKFPKSWETNETAGKEWARGFIERNGALSLRTPEPTSLSRSTAFNRHTVGEFFQNLTKVYETYQFGPSRIWNVDETGLTTVHQPGKIIAGKGVKQVGKMTSAERGELVTVCSAISASGNHIPPFMILPRVNWQDRMLDGAPAGTKGTTNPSGWMTTPNFKQFLVHFCEHTSSSLNNKTLVIMDNHDSHISVDSLTYAKKNGIVLLTIPPHTSHKLQPLDRTVFGPLKAYYNVASSEWMTIHPGRAIKIYDIAGLLGNAYPKAMSPTNIISGFRVTGIWPLNSTIFTDDEFLTSYVTDRPNPTNVENSETAEIFNPIPSTSGASVATTPKQVAENQVGNIFSPKDILPFPKAPPRSSNLAIRGRKRAKSRILTETPEKAKIEEEFRQREEKKSKKSVEKQKKKVEVVKKKVLMSSSDEDSDQLSFHDSSSDSNFLGQSSESETEEIVTANTNLHFNDFVIVKFPTKRAIKYFIGKIEGLGENEIEVNFLRKKDETFQFFYPEIPDKSFVQREDCIVKLPQPKMFSGTIRTAGVLSFPIRFAKYF